MAGRHRKPPAWRRVLTSMLRARNRVRTAAMRAEIIALRATIADLQAELVTLREAALATADPAVPAAPVVAAAPALRPVVLDLPLVRLALDDVAVDRGADTALTEIVLADLPERPLLDPRTDRDSEPVDVAVPVGSPVAAPEHRRTA